MSGSGADRRITERRLLRTNATVILGASHAFTVRTIDVSTGGMGIVAQANPRPGTMLAIRFVLPLRPTGQMQFEAKARVVHSVFSSSEAGFKVGLSFVDLTPDAAAGVASFLG